jgi:NADH-quinone oxidoreductase subunit H
MTSFLTEGATLTTNALLGQASSVLNVGDSFLLSTLLKIAFVLGLFFVVPLVGGYLEHKVMGRMQDRRGPVEAGPFGSLQLVADGIKFIQKEDLIPAAADKWVFAIAPGVALVPAMLIFLVVPSVPASSPRTSSSGCSTRWRSPR